MADNLTADTALALLRAAQGDSPQAAAKSLKAAKQAGKSQEIGEAAKEFEAVFIAEMMKPMFENVKTDGMFGGGKAEEIFRSLMLQEYGKMMAQTGQIGIADHVKEELIKIQENADKENADNESS